MRIWWAVLGIALAQPIAAQQIESARFIESTQRYGHAVLGDDIEWGALEIKFNNISIGSLLQQGVVSEYLQVFRLPIDHVFEDVEPRLWDVTGDGHPEVVVVETDAARGAALAIYDTDRKIAETPHIGTSNRWLAPIGAADMDGDGLIEVAYVDRPHLAKTIRVWRFEKDKLVPVADLPGYTNHRIGEADIAGGVRICAGQPEMIVATADWTRLAAVTYRDGVFAVKDIGPHRGRGSFRNAMACK